MGYATSAQQSLEHATASRQSASPRTSGDGAQTSRAPGTSTLRHHSTLNVSYAYVNVRYMYNSAYVIRSLCISFS